MNNNIELIKNFLLSEDKNLLINQVNDEIGSFYKFVINELSRNIGTLLVNMTVLDEYKDTIGLFENKKIYIYDSTNSKNIDIIRKNKFQKIIFTDYKNYKKYKSANTVVNGYDFEKDIKFLLINYFDISNDLLINFCLEQPYLTYSETTKYKANNKGYSKDTAISDSDNFILNIRKDIFKMKRDGFSIKGLFLKLKNEVHYKKFSFLTF